jgi:cysteine sulfinate desulfinase/cysteine desulfurase-like protein
LELVVMACNMPRPEGARAKRIAPTRPAPSSRSRIADIANRAGIPFHTDAAQSAGKIDTKVAELGVNMMSLAAHKMYGPKGIGALFVRRGTGLEPHNHGAGHEAGRRVQPI